VVKARKTALLSAFSAALLAGCGNPSKPAEAEAGAKTKGEPLLESLAPAGWTDASAKFVDRKNQPAGYAAVADTPSGGVLIRIDLKGLTQGWHGIHLHQVADCSDYAEGFTASGGHVDPDNREHGLLNPEGPERADLPNIYAGADNRATAEIYDGSVAVFASEAAAAEIGPFPLMDADGFAIIVHANADDHKTQPIGGAGERVACAAFPPQG